MNIAGGECVDDQVVPLAFVESTINQVVSKRMVKKQQMRWSQRGAHLLLQVRTRVLNNELREQFQQWYPRFVQQEQPLKKAAQLPRFFSLSHDIVPFYLIG